MKTADRKALGEYLRWVADHMGLRDWTFHLRHDECDENAYATVSCTEGHREAVVRFCSDFRDLERAKVRHVVVHELVHCLAAAVTDHLKNDVGDVMGEREHAAWWPLMRVQCELMVDTTAEAISPHMPLIKWPKPKKKGKS